MATNAEYLQQQLTDQQNEYDKVRILFDQAKADFEETTTDPGSGFDIQEWLDLMPTPGLRKAGIADVLDPTSYFANDTAPSVAPPELLTPEQISALAEDGYDSQYLEDMEQEIRVLTADIVAAALPAGLYDDYFRQGNVRRARATRDDIDDIKAKEGRRGFPSAPMSVARQIGDRIGKWQDENYSQYNDVGSERLAVATELFFSSVKSGEEIEAVRSRVIMDYAKLYSQHNKTLIGYYDQLVNEKTAAAQLLLDNINADLKQSYADMETIKNDNKEEIELPERIYQQALKRLAIEFDIDKELLERRQGAMQFITNVYGAWMTATVGTSQSTVSAKHDVTAE